MRRSLCAADRAGRCTAEDSLPPQSIATLINAGGFEKAVEGGRRLLEQKALLAEAWTLATLCLREVSLDLRVTSIKGSGLRRTRVMHSLRKLESSNQQSAFADSSATTLENILEYL